MDPVLKKLSYDTFKDLAKSCTDEYVRVGFPAEYRAGKSQIILQDILSKLTILRQEDKRFLEIGPGWSDLTKEILNYCNQFKHAVTFIDSDEMLALIPENTSLKKIAGQFPKDVRAALSEEKFDAILVYSVLQYPFAEGNINSFVDFACMLLKEGGQLLIGDIPNISMRKRFFASQTGRAHHQSFVQDPSAVPEVTFNQLESEHIDDGVLMGLLIRLRNAGFHAFLVPQGQDLPMANRREDLLIIKP